MRVFTYTIYTEYRHVLFAFVKYTYKRRSTRKEKNKQRNLITFKEYIYISFCIRGRFRDFIFVRTDDLLCKLRFCLHFVLIIMLYDLSVTRGNGMTFFNYFTNGLRCV